MAVLLKNSSSSFCFFRLLFVLLGISITGCQNSPEHAKNISNTNNTAMGGYTASIHSLALPFKDSCYDTLAIQKQNLPDSLSKFTIYGQLVGKIEETKQYVAILYSIPADIQLPVLHTFNTKGQLISSLKLFIGNCCGENEDCSGVSTAEITKDLHIILKDSMQTFERDKKKSDKKRNIQIVKKQEEFRIDSTGKIISLSH